MDVTIFEEVPLARPSWLLMLLVLIDEKKGERLSLDAASMSVPNLTRGCNDQVDLPMRAFAGGFYRNLKAMYDYLGVEYVALSFLFSFSVGPSHKLNSDLGLLKPGAYFIHSSNSHRIPPLKPEGIKIFEYGVQLVYLLLCYAWYTLCCFLVPPGTHGKRETSETFGQYLARIRLPQHFADYYLLPLMSAVTTCPHSTLLQFPACDLTEYKKTDSRS